MAQNLTSVAGAPVLARAAAAARSRALEVSTAAGETAFSARLWMVDFSAAVALVVRR